MDGIDVGDFGSADNAIDSQITIRAWTFTDTYSLIGQLYVHRVGVCLRIHRHRFDVQLATGSNDANCDFASVGNQDFLEHGLRGDDAVPGNVFLDKEGNVRTAVLFD
jgi:hypothetical protein